MYLRNIFQKIVVPPFLMGVLTKYPNKKNGLDITFESKTIYYYSNLKYL